MGGAHQLFEVLGCAEMGVNFEEVLCPVTVVVIDAGTLPQYRTDPERGDPESLQVAEFGLYPLQGPAEPLGSRILPVLDVGQGLDGVVRVPRRKQWRAALHDLAGGVLVAILRFVGETVYQQEVDHLVRPVPRRRVIVVLLQNFRPRNVIDAGKHSQVWTIRPRRGRAVGFTRLRKSATGSPLTHKTPRQPKSAGSLCVPNTGWSTVAGAPMWRWGELNPRPMSCCQGFSGRSLRRIFSAPAMLQTAG